MVKPVFIFSQPRAGSTLLQRVLAGHPAVHTTGETWLLLPLLYALRRGGALSEYGHALASMGVGDLCEATGEGKVAYYRAVCAAAMRLYGEASPDSARFFVEKTPRYYFIASELVEHFREASFVFLWRQPLSSAASMISLWGGGRWGVYAAHHDLYTAPRLLVEARRLAGDRAVSLRYEDLVMDTGASVRRVLEHIGLDATEEEIERMERDVGTVRVEGFGDPTGQTAYGSMSRDPLEKWKGAITNRARKAWCVRYLAELGDEVIGAMGYDASVIRGEVDAISTGSGVGLRDAVGLRVDGVRSAVRSWLLSGPDGGSLPSHLRHGGAGAG